MPLLIIYLIKLTITVTVLYLFYQLVLRRLTFYNWNRLYLFIYTVLAFFIPLINISPAIEKENVLPSAFIEFIPPVDNIATRPEDVSTNVAIGEVGAWDIIQVMLFCGLLFFITRLVIHFISLARLKRKSILISEAGIRIYQVDKNIIPFSFGDSIFINQQLHDEKELKDIIRHEFIHVKQKHTVDIIWSELFCALNWYNPFAWLIRKSIRQNLEFIADANVLDGGIDRKDYQYLLLKVMGSAKYRIASQFNFSSLKKRIAMMNKIKSAKIHLTKFLFILPLMSVLLLAFRNELTGNRVIVRYVAMVIDKDSRQPIEGVTITDQETGQKVKSDQNGYYVFELPANKKMNVHLKFDKEGYASYTNSSFSLLKADNKTSMVLFAIDELQKGKAGVTCTVCSTTETVSDLGSEIPGYEEIKQYYNNYLRNIKTGNYVPLTEGVNGFDNSTTGTTNSRITDINIKADIKFTEDNLSKDGVFIRGLEKGHADTLPTVHIYAENVRVIPKDTVPEKSEDYKAFLQRNNSVKNVFWMSSPFRIGIQLKDGKVEIYTLDQKDEVKAAENKYGKLPEAPPPPPPAPPHRDNNKNISNAELKGTVEDVVMKIEASVLSLYPGNRLKFSGNVMIESNEDKISSDEIDMKIAEIDLLIMDGVEISSAAVIVNEGKRKYELTVLKKERAIEKYGTKGKKGALILKTL